MPRRTLSFIAVFLLVVSVANGAKEEYDEDEKPYVGKVQIMPIVQRNKSVASEKVEEIIKQLPTDDSYERIGKMLNNSLDRIKQDVQTGENAIRERFHTSKTNLTPSQLTIYSTLFTAIFVAFKF